MIATFPTNFELDLVLQEYVIERKKFLGEELMPTQDYFTQRVLWDFKDNELGFTPPHAMGADPFIEQRPGSNLMEFSGIPFKATEIFAENELLRARELGTIANVLDLSNEVVRRMKARTDKDFISKEYLIWQALQGGYTLNMNNVYVSETFPIQTYTSSVAWSTSATATPLHDFDAVKLLFRGTGARAEGAKAYMNQTTLNQLLENTNSSDIQGFRNENFLALTFSLEEANKILSARGLPQIVVYDEGYYDAGGTFRLFIADGKVIVKGQRTQEQRIGEFALTPSLHRTKAGMPAPGFFAFINVNGHDNPGSMNVDFQSLGNSKNPKLEITTGFYGGPLIFFPQSIVLMNVS